MNNFNPHFECCVLKLKKRPLVLILAHQDHSSHVVQLRGLQPARGHRLSLPPSHHQVPDHPSHPRCGKDRLHGSRIRLQIVSFEAHSDSG